MLKKRIIFTLLYDSGNFVLSRNFRLQKVGNIDWLKKNYDFSKISFYIDELIVLDVSRKNRDLNLFCENLKILTKDSFVPVAAGGGINSYEHASKLLKSGADKLVLNSSLFNNKKLLENLVKAFGRQCIVGSLDINKNNDLNYDVLINNGSKIIHKFNSELTNVIDFTMIGEFYLNSINRDGTGQGFDFNILNFFNNNNTPIILAGGAGNSLHLSEGLLDRRVDAVATAHLFNFVGDGLKKARLNLINSNISLAKWENIEYFFDKIN